MTPKSYIAAQEPQQQTILQELMAIIQSTAPLATPKMSYGVICYVYHYMLVGISAKKKGCCSLHIMSTAMTKILSEDLKQVDYKGSTIHFPLNQSLPQKLITKVVRLRMKENEQRLELRKTKGK